MKKLTIFTLILSMLCAAGCTAGESPSADETTDSSPTEAAETDGASDETTLGDGIGDYDFGGESFTMYTRYTDMFYPSLNVEEITGDQLNDVIYERNRELETRFNFTFDEEKYYNTVEGNDAPRVMLAAGDDTYDLITGRYLNMYNYAAEGYLIPITEVPVIDVTKPWWNTEMYQNLSIYDRHYFAVGAFNLSAYDFTHVMLFNKTMASELGVPDLYELVTSGGWTFDKFSEYGLLAFGDINGDGEYTDADRYGYTSRPSAVMPGFWIAAGVEPVTVSADGALEFTAHTNERFLDICSRVFDITRNNHIWYESLNGTPGDNQPSELFRAGGALFMDAKLYEVTKLRDSDIDFGIIPYPKYTEEQENYLSRMEGCELFVVPKTNTNPEMAGVILEAMAYESEQTVLPAYYEVMLKTKVSRDEQSSAMLDLILDHLVFDLGDTLLGTEFRDGTMNECFYENRQELVSILTEMSGVYQKVLDNFNEAFKELEA